MTVSHEGPLSVRDNWLCGVFHDKLFPCRLLLKQFAGSAGIKVLCLTFLVELGKCMTVKYLDSMWFKLCFTFVQNGADSQHPIFKKHTTSYI